MAARAGGPRTSRTRSGCGSSPSGGQARYEAAERYRLPEIDALDAGPEPAELWGIDGLDWLLAESDYLACTLPLTGETRGLIGRP